MFRRLIALGLCLMLCLAAALPTLAEALSNEQKVEKLAGLMRDYIAQEGFKSYEYDEDKERYTSVFELDSALGECDVLTYIYYDMLSVLASPALKVPEQYRDNMAKFITLINGDLYYSYLRMDYQSGSVTSRGYLLIEEVFPTTKEIDVVHYMTIGALDDWGNGIVQVAGGADPVATYEQVRAALDAAD